MPASTAVDLFSTDDDDPNDPGGSVDSYIDNSNCAGFDDYVNLAVNLLFSFHNRCFHPPAIDDWSEKD